MTWRYSAVRQFTPQANQQFLAAAAELNALAAGLAFVRVGDGVFVIGDLPTTDPGVANQVWNDGGTLKISAG